MNALIIGFYSILIAASSSPLAPFTYQSEHSNIGVPFIQARGFGQDCPPVFPSTLEVAESYFEGSLPRSLLAPVVEPNAMARAFDVPELTLDDLEALTDRQDAEICRSLNEELGPLINLAVKVVEGPGTEIKYLYEISYFRASRQGMYLALASAPVIISEDQAAKIMLAIAPPGPGTFVRFYDMTGEPIFSQDVRSRLDSSSDKEKD